MDARSESPLKSMRRLAIHDAGLPMPTPQLEVTDRFGRFIARLEFGWKKEKVGVEYDGAVHHDRAVYGRDIERHNDLRDEGWLVFQLGAARWQTRNRVLDSVAAALTSRGDGCP